MNPDENIKYILDPLSAIIKLYILSKKQIGCKLCIYNNAIVLQDSGIFQSFVRYYFNNSKNDIQYLYNPIEIASHIYLSKDFIEKFPIIKILFQHAIKGLENLIGTYNNHNNNIIIHSLYMYINIISNHTGDRYNERLFIRDSISNMYTNEVIHKFKLLWTDDKIKVLLEMIEFIEKINNTNESIRCLEEFISSIDKEVYLFAFI